MNTALTVSQFVDVVNGAFDAVGALTVEGEVAEFKIIHNKWVTFQLKDNESTVPCFMTVWQLRTQVEDGMLVRVSGMARLRPKGFFSFVLNTVQPAGEGAIKRAFELLKRKLAEEGLFASERKRPLPRFPQHIALITSRDAAAYSDFLKILNARQGGLTISFIHTQVQGEDAPDQLIAALQTANTELTNLDAIVMVRGGGSLEDLQAFNDEAVVRAVAASRTPIVVGVGHERDTSLAELAADVRASTPSNAAELLVRSRQELSSDLAHLTLRLRGKIQDTLNARRGAVLQNVRALEARVTSTANQIRRRIDLLLNMRGRFIQETRSYAEQITRFQHQLGRRYRHGLTEKNSHLAQLQRILKSLSPDQVLARGFSITRTTTGKVVHSTQDVTADDELITTVHKGIIHSKVTK